MEILAHRSAGQRRRRGSWVVPLSVAVLCASSAAAKADDAAVKACNAKAVSTLDIVNCQVLESSQVEGDLQAAYQKAMASLPEDQKAKLLNAERLWVKFRESDCDVYYGQGSGTYASIQGGICMVQHARDRIRDLKTFSEP